MKQMADRACGPVVKIIFLFLRVQAREIIRNPHRPISQERYNLLAELAFANPALFKQGVLEEIKSFVVPVGGAGRKRSVTVFFSEAEYKIISASAGKNRSRFLRESGLAAARAELLRDKRRI